MTPRINVKKYQRGSRVEYTAKTQQDEQGSVRCQTRNNSDQNGALRSGVRSVGVVIMGIGEDVILDLTDTLEGSGLSGSIGASAVWVDVEGPTGPTSCAPS